MIIKVLNAFFRWLNAPVTKDQSATGHTKNYSNFSKYSEVEEADFTEIKTDSEKEKV